MATVAETFDEHWIEDPQTGCWIWQRARKGKEAAGGGGYGCLRIAGKCIGAHRFSYERKYGPVPTGLQVRHQCQNTLCVNPAHMLLGTNDDNVQDRLVAGRSAKKLTSKDVLTIRKRCAAGELQRVVGTDYGLYQACVSNIVNRKYWSHV